MSTTRTGWRAGVDVALIVAFLGAIAAPTIRQLTVSDDEAVLREQRKALEAMAEQLLTKRVLERQDLKDFFNERGFKIDWRDPEVVIRDADGEVVEE